MESELYLGVGVAVALMFFGYKLAVTPSATRETATVQGSVIRVKVITASQTKAVEIHSSSSVEQLVPQVFTPSELESKTPVFVCMGRRLQNDRSLVEQGITHEANLHTQLVNASRSPPSTSEVVPYRVLLALTGLFLAILWGIRYNYPFYFAKVPTMLLGAFSCLWTFVALSYLKGS